MRFLTILLIVSFVCACTESEITETTTKEVPKESTLFDAQTDALDKADSVEQSLQNNLNDRDEEMRKQGI